MMAEYGASTMTGAHKKRKYDPQEDERSLLAEASDYRPNADMGESSPQNPVATTVYSGGVAPTPTSGTGGGFDSVPGAPDPIDPNQPIGGVGPQNPQPLPEGAGSPVPVNPTVDAGGKPIDYQPPAPTTMYETQQPAPIDDPWTYEQTWIDPYIKDNLLQRDPYELQSTMADIAAGQMSPVVQQQRERAMQAALAAAASSRGAPTAAIQRGMTQQMAEADRSAMEAAAQQQLQAMQGVDQMTQAEAQINAQVEQQRDSMLDSLIGRGVDRNVALAQVNAELDRLKEELTYKYWAGRQGSTTELLKSGYEHADFGEGGVESVAEIAPILNLLLGGQLPEGYNLPTTQVLADYTDDPQGFFTETTTQQGGGMDEMVWNHETQSWEMQQGTPGVPQSLGVQDFSGQQVEVFRTWNDDKNIYEYSFEPYGYTAAEEAVTGAGSAIDDAAGDYSGPPLPGGIGN